MVEKIKNLYLIILLLFFSSLAIAQQDAECTQIDCPGRCGMYSDKNKDGFCDHGLLSDDLNKKNRNYFDNPYHLITISGSLILLYLVTLFLHKKRIIKKITHQRIWNILLAISFLVSGILGLLLVFFINYQYFPSYYLDIKTYHVEFGIAMAIISIFHLLWHLNYYKAIFTRKKT